MNSNIFISSLWKPIRLAFKAGTIDLLEYPTVITETIERIKLWDLQLKLHINANKYQRNLYKRQLKKLKNREIMVIADYSVQETKNQGKVSILSFATIDSSKKIKYFDYFFEKCEGNNILGLAWEDLFTKIDVPTKLYLWSDRGRKDFVNKDVITMYKKIASYYEMTMIYSTFESKHGHSICDGHFGVGKKKIKRDINIESSSAQWTIEFVMKTFELTKNTQVLFIDSKNKKEIFADIQFSAPDFEISDCRCFYFSQEKFEYYNFTSITF